MKPEEQEKLIAKAIRAKCAEIEHRATVHSADAMYFSDEYAAAVSEAISSAGYVLMPREASESFDDSEKIAHAEDADLLFQTYMGMLVLRTILKKQNLQLGAERTEELLGDIQAAHPEFAARSALRSAVPSQEGKR